MELKKQYGLWIGGKELEPSSGRYFKVIDPSNGTVLANAGRGEQVDIEHAVDDARRAFYATEWRDLKPYERGRLLFRLADKVNTERDRLAQLLSMENGKPLRQSYDEIETVIRNFEYYGGWADKVHGRVIPISEGVLDYIRQEPLGVVGHIIPWNYPLDIFSRGVAPCLAIGNTVVVKPAEETPLSSIELGRLTGEVGFPPGVVNVVSGFGPEAGAALAEHPGIQGLAFCGSIKTGREVLRLAAKNITHVVSLELGGKSPLIIFADADIEQAAISGAYSILYNTGQSCGCLSRVLVQKTVVDQVTLKIKETLANVHAGSWEQDLDFGPLVSSRQMQRVLEYIELGKNEGANVAIGGQRIYGRPFEHGFFIEPTVFTDVRPGMRIVEEEIFGPVLAIMAFDSEEQAVELANASQYGLSAEVWTRNLTIAHRVASRLDVSHVTINGGGGFGIEAPFGGIKRSGFGREGGYESILQYSRVKNVWVNL